MKGRTVFLLAPLLLASFAASSRNPLDPARSALAGNWVFQVLTGTNVTHGHMTLAPGDRGSSGTLSTDQGDNELIVRTATLVGSKMRLVVDSPNGEVVFEGTLDEAQRSFDGIVTYYTGQRFPMSGNKSGS